MYRYRIHGLEVASDFPLPDARPAAGDACDVQITVEPGIAPCAATEVTLRGDAAQATLSLPGIATFAFLDGTRMTVTRHSDDDELIRTFILGSAWAVLLHQRGVLILHGCALEWGGTVHLFVGEQRAGKSTLAAALLRAGARLVSDDVTAIDLSGNRPRVLAGLRSMKLAVADPALGEDLGPTCDGAKRRIVPHRLTDTDTLPLAAVVELARGSAATSERLRGAAACGIALRHTFRGLATARLGQSAQHLAACSALAGMMPFHRLTRPWDLAAVPATAASLIAGGVATAAIAA